MVKQPERVCFFYGQFGAEYECSVELLFLLFHGSPNFFHIRVMDINFVYVSYLIFYMQVSAKISRGYIARRRVFNHSSCCKIQNKWSFCNLPLCRFWEGLEEVSEGRILITSSFLSCSLLQIFTAKSVMQVIGGLWILSMVGSWFSFWTLFYIGQSILYVV